MVGLFRKRFLVVGKAALVGGSLLFSACSTPSVQRICNEEFSRFDQQLEEALVAIGAPALLGEGERALASSAAPDPEPEPLTEADRDRWLSWTERQLNDIQGAILAVPDMEHSAQRAPAKAALHQVANQLVMMEGQAHRGDRAAMIRLLRNMEKPQRLAQKHFCSP